MVRIQGMRMALSTQVFPISFTTGRECSDQKFFEAVFINELRRRHAADYILITFKGVSDVKWVMILDAIGNIGIKAKYQHCGEPRPYA